MAKPDEKVKQTISNYITHAQKYIADNKKDFSSFSTIYHRFIKKDKLDPAYEYTKEIIKRFEKDKMSPQLAMQVTEELLPAMQNIRKELIIAVIPMIIGLVGIVTFLILIAFTKPLMFTNMFFVGYLLGVFISSILLGVGIFKRNKIKLETLTKMMLYQASTAYSAAKMQGQGSFAALRILDEMKANPSKQLQVKVSQPKYMHR